MKKILLSLLFLSLLGYVQAQLCWQQAGIDIDGEAAINRSGWSVSVSSDGNTVAIGAINNDGNGDDAGQVLILSHNSAGLKTRYGC